MSMGAFCILDFARQSKIRVWFSILIFKLLTQEKARPAPINAGRAF